MQPYVAYYRVSTAKQGESGLGLEAQQSAVLAHMKSEPIAAFTEVESGGKFARPQLDAALAFAKANKATLVIAKLDRLSRNAHLVSCLLESGVEFLAVDNPHATPLFIRILAAVAQEEREQIGKRVKSALQAAKARGVKLGGAQASTYERQARTDAIDMEAIKSVIDAGAVGYNAIARGLNERDVRTSKGGTWSPMQVKRIMERNP